MALAWRVRSRAIRVQSRGSDPVALGEGDTLLTPDGQYAFTISYVGGGSGHDVVLTCVAPPAGAATSTPLDTPADSPSRVGQDVTLSAHLIDGSNNPATSGTVTFFDGLHPLATVAVNGSGVAAFTTDALERSSVIVDPSEEKLKHEFAGVEQTLIPLHAVIRIDAVDKSGNSKVVAVASKGGKVATLPTPIYTPGKPKG